jgi:hypothetical protein
MVPIASENRQVLATAGSTGTRFRKRRLARALPLKFQNIEIYDLVNSMAFMLYCNFEERGFG